MVRRGSRSITAEGQLASREVEVLVPRIEGVVVEAVPGVPALVRLVPVPPRRIGSCWDLVDEGVPGLVLILGMVVPNTHEGCTGPAVFQPISRYFRRLRREAVDSPARIAEVIPPTAHQVWVHPDETGKEY